MGQQKGGHAPMTENQAMTAGERLSYALQSLEARRDELSAVLPPDQSFESFHATINQALRANPDLLTCDGRSLINACVKAAYDGLRIDGREAAIVWDMMTPPGGGQKVKTARYMPMYQGLVQQVLRGGLVLACEADVIYENDVYRIIRGSSPQIIHEPLLTGDRGAMIAVYNVATLPSGLRTTAYLTAAQVLDIQKESKSGWKDGKPAGVWARWPREQWKKTILRQHRKTLPVGTHPIRDMEQGEDFPQFDRSTPHPQLAAAPPRPTRGMLVDQASTEAGVTLDVSGDRERDVVEHKQAEKAEQRGPSRKAEDAAIDVPEDAAAWAVWEADVEKRIAAAVDAIDVDGIWSEIQPVLQAANKGVRDRITGKVTERNSDLALEAAGTGTADED